MDRRKRVLNIQEAGVDRVLRDYAREHGYQLSLKMRLRDAIEIDDLPLTKRERDFAFMAHLDFVAFDASTHLPVLAVEYDGQQHLSDPKQIERDEIKDRLCDLSELPMLRIDNTFTRKQGKWRVLAYILWAHETGKAFCEAQQQGYIPQDEPFYHGSVITPDESGQGYTFEGLDVAANRSLLDFRTRHKAMWECQWWRREGGLMESRAVLAMPNDQYLAAHCAVRDFAIEGIAALDIAMELCTAELGWLARGYENGEAVALNRQQGEALLRSIGHVGGDEFVTRNGWHMSTGWGSSL